MQLVIAEKPSVAKNMAQVLGADSFQGGFMEGNGYVVIWWNRQNRRLMGNSGKSGRMRACQSCRKNGSTK